MVKTQLPDSTATSRKCVTVSLSPAGLKRNPTEAVRWLRKAHQDQDSVGGLELALLLIKEPALATDSGEGERLLRHFSEGSDNARYELGKLLMNGEGLTKDEAGGFQILLSLAESGHAHARSDIQFLCFQWYDPKPQLHFNLPSWAMVFKERLKAFGPGVFFSRAVSPQMTRTTARRSGLGYFMTGIQNTESP